ncbi:MAG TPA: carbohydrate binding domain-containing protein [Polyangiaceae bacterium]|nr:carbohydrate binding domain-containing protein [Polyangiaceae bacterium]
MRSFRELRFSLAALTSLGIVAACEPDLEPLSAQFGSGGRAQTGGSGGTTASGGASQGGTTGDTGGTTTGQGGATGTEVPDTCSDLRRNADESDVDCGGTSLCDRCEINGRCTRHGDCATELCVKGRCAEPSCEDLILNQNETGTDCGGVCAPASLCPDETACKVNGDCQSDYCKDEVCTDHCSSKKIDADETDKDCGGTTCDPCPNDSACLKITDCASGVCKNNICVPPSCQDDVKNQDESDIDCGGVCSPDQACPNGKKCVKGTDCESLVCSGSPARCVPDIVIAEGDMIDNFEDGDNIIPRISGRAGNWYRFDDQTGTSLFEPKFPDRGTSKFALHYAGQDFQNYSGIGVDLNNTGGSESTKGLWDGSGHTGITFWGRGDKPATVKVQMADKNTSRAGGICTATNTCDKHWYKIVTISGDWKRYTLSFADFVLEPGNMPEPAELDIKNLVAIQILFGGGSPPFDIWIDDVALTR